MPTHDTQNSQKRYQMPSIEIISMPENLDNAVKKTNSTHTKTAERDGVGKHFDIKS